MFVNLSESKMFWPIPELYFAIPTGSARSVSTLVKLKDDVDY